jgi:hypothetical protein
LAKFGVETEAVPGFRAPKNNLKETLPRKTTSWYVANAFDEGFQLSFHHVSITAADFDPDRAVFDKEIPIGKPIIDPQTGVMNAEFVPDSTLNAAPKSCIPVAWDLCPLTSISPRI